MARQRLDLRAAAEKLGTTVDAVRKRVSRGTLEGDKDPDGRVYVWLDTGQPQSDTDALISEMRAHNETLREQLAAEREAHAESRRLLLRALESIPQAIEAPETSETGAQGVREDRPQDAPPRSDEPRSWWRRLWGG